MTVKSGRRSKSTSRPVGAPGAARAHCGNDTDIQSKNATSADAERGITKVYRENDRNEVGAHLVGSSLAGPLAGRVRVRSLP